MPVSFHGATATFAGDCTVEEAGPLTEWLLAHPKGRAQLRTCTGLHAALLQTLMALRPAIVALPVAADLAGVIAPVLPPVTPASTRKRAPAPELAA